MDAVADDDDGKEQPETEKPEVQTPATKQVRIVCASGFVNIRVGNDTKYSRITSVKDGATFEWIATAEERLARHRGQCSGGVGVREVFAGRLTNIYNVETHIGAGAIRPHFLYMAA